MKFSEVAGIYEQMRLSSLNASKRDALRQITNGSDAALIFHLFFDRTYTTNSHWKSMPKGELAGMFAEEVGVFVDVVLDALGEDSLAMALAQESDKSTTRGYTIVQMMGVIESFMAGKMKVLDAAHGMNEIEARLFWTHVLGERVNITPHAYLMCLGMNAGVPKDAMKRHIALKEPLALLHTIYDDPKSLDVPSRWYEETDMALTPRRYEPFMPYDNPDIIMSFNKGLYQRIPDKGKTRMLYVLPEAGGTRLVWRDRAGRMNRPNAAPNVDWLPQGPLILEVSLETDDRTGHSRLVVFDAIFPRYPHLTLRERLEKLHTHLKEHEEENRLKIEGDDWLYPDVPVVIHDLSGPHNIAKVVSWSDENHIVRFPDIGPFDPFSKGGYVLVKSHAIKLLRLSAVRKSTDDSYEVRLCCLDGIEDFIDVVEAEVTGDVKNHLQGTLSRLTNLDMETYPPLQVTKSWTDVPDDIMIVIEVLVPSIEFDENGPVLQDTTVSCIREDLGIGDVMQYVDLLYGGEIDG